MILKNTLVINENAQRIFEYQIKLAKTERITLEFFRILNLYDTFIPLKTMLGPAILLKLYAYQTTS
jgi:hypothetical protein